MMIVKAIKSIKMKSRTFFLFFLALPGLSSAATWCGPTNIKMLFAMEMGHVT